MKKYWKSAAMALFTGMALCTTSCSDNTTPSGPE